MSSLIIEFHCIADDMGSRILVRCYLERKGRSAIRDASKLGVFDDRQ